MKSEGKWYLEFEIEVNGTDGVGDPTGGTWKMRLPIGSGQSPSEAAELGETLWNNLSSEMIERHRGEKFDFDDNVEARNPRVVWLGKRTNVEKELRSSW